MPVRARTRPTGPLETFELRQVGVYVGDAPAPVSVANLDARGGYRITNLPVGRSLRLEPMGLGWRYDSRGKTVRCARAGQTLRVDIHIDGVMID